MAISLTSIGTASSKASGTISITVGAGGVPSGSLIIVAYCDSTTNAAPTDTAGNTYNLISSSVNCTVYYAYNSIALVSTNTIHYTGGGRSAMTAFYATGIRSVSDPYQSSTFATASGSSTSPSVQMAAVPVTSGNSLVVGFVGTNGPSGDTFTQDSGDSFVTPPVRIGTTGASGGSNSTIAGGNVQSAARLTFNPIISSAAWVAKVAAFIPAAATFAGAITEGSASSTDSINVSNNTWLCAITESGAAVDVASNLYVNITESGTATDTTNGSTSPIQLLSSGWWGAYSGQPDPVLNTIGAKLLIATMSIIDIYGILPTIYDDASNTWTLLKASHTLTTGGGFEDTFIFYCVPVYTSATHGFASTNDHTYTMVEFSAWSGVATSPVDVGISNSSETTSTSISTGSVTPSQDNALVISVLSAGALSVQPSIDSLFSLLSYRNTTGDTAGAATAYQIQGTKAAVNLTWTVSGSQQLATSIVSFLAQTVTVSTSIITESGTATDTTNASFTLAGAITESGTAADTTNASFALAGNITESGSISASADRFKTVSSTLTPLTGSDDTYIHIVSKDSSTLFGVATLSSSTVFAVRWTAETGLVRFDFPIGATSYCRVLGCSADGSIALFDIWDDPSQKDLPYLWSVADGWTLLPDTSSVTGISPAYISDDGLIVCGAIWDIDYNLSNGYFWTSITGAISVAPLTGGTNLELTQISQDGTVYGFGNTSSGGHNVLVSYTAGGGLINLGEPTVNSNNVSGIGIQCTSYDLRSILVYTVNVSSTKFWYVWTANDGFVSIPSYPSSTNSNANGISNDVVVGSATVADPFSRIQGWTWTAQNGFSDITITPAGNAGNVISGDGGGILCIDNGASNDLAFFRNGKLFLLAGTVFSDYFRAVSYDDTLIVVEKADKTYLLWYREHPIVCDLTESGTASDSTNATRNRSIAEAISSVSVINSHLLLVSNTGIIQDKLTFVSGSDTATLNVVSGDGSTAFGTSNFNFNNAFALRWTLADGLTSIGLPPNVTSSFVPKRSSADGTVFLAADWNNTTSHYETSLWTQGSGWANLTIGASGSTPYDLSADGTMVCGTTSSNGFVWTASGTTTVSPLTGGTTLYLSMISPTGTVYGASNITGGHNVLVSWTAGGGLVSVGEPTVNSNNVAGISTGPVASYDRSRIAGITWDSSNHHYPWVWTAATGFVSIPLLAGTLSADPVSVSNNRVVGSCSISGVTTGWEWTPAGGTVATTYFGGVVSGDDSTEIYSAVSSVQHRFQYGTTIALTTGLVQTALSYDGSTIVGHDSSSPNKPVVWYTHNRVVTEAISSTSVMTSAISKVAPSLAETIASTSSISAALKRSRSIAEAISSSTSISATQHKIGAITETISSTSSINAALKRNRSITEAISSTSSISAALKRNRSIAEAISSSTSISATPHKTGVIAETISSTSSISAALKRNRSIAEVISSSSSISATQHKIGAIAETISSSSSISATQHKIGAIGETIASTTVVSGYLSKLSSGLNVTIMATTAVSATIHALRPLNETIQSTSLLGATQQRSRAVAETISSTSSISAALKRNRSIAEAISSTSSISAAISSTQSSRPIAETISATSVVVGQPHKISKIAETISATSQVVATLTRSRSVTESINALSVLTGGLLRGRRIDIAETIQSFSQVITTIQRSHNLSEDVVSSSLMAINIGKVKTPLAATYVSRSSVDLIVNRSRQISFVVDSHTIMTGAISMIVSSKLYCMWIVPKEQRTWIIPTQSRTYTVAQKNNVWAIGSEIRTKKVAKRNDIWTVKKQDRIWRNIKGL